MLIFKKLVKRYRYLHYFFLWTFRYFPNSLKFNTRRVLRFLNWDVSGEFSYIRNYKNKHKNERCFIVATGPSLNVSDLAKLDGEITFSMNSIILSFEDTTWRPTYYGIQDSRAYDALKNQIETANMDTIFCGISTKKNSPKVNGNYIAYPLNLLNHNGGFIKHYTKFSSDAYSVIYDGFTITYSLLQIAVYMGFEEIYLLGVDCNYPEKGKNHIKNYIDQPNKNAAYLMEESYKIAKEYALKNNIKIYNASRGGNLDVFERVDYDSLEFLKETRNENTK